MSFMSRFRKQESVSASAAPPPYTPTPPPKTNGYSTPGGAGGAGGFAIRQRDPVPPPGADPKLWSHFLAVDVDHSGQISLQELQRALINGDWSPFDLDTVKLLMNLFDTDRSGDIGFNEFTSLWQYIKDWQNVFRHFDQDNSGTIDGSELQSALDQFGMKLPQHLLWMVVAKFASASSGSDVIEKQTISFDRFLRACVFMKNFNEAFANLDTDKDGWVQLDYDQLLSFYLSLP